MSLKVRKYRIKRCNYEFRCTKVKFSVRFCRAKVQCCDQLLRHEFGRFLMHTFRSQKFHSLKSSSGSIGQFIGKKLSLHATNQIMKTEAFTIFKLCTIAFLERTTAKNMLSMKSHMIMAFNMQRSNQYFDLIHEIL